MNGIQFVQKISQNSLNGVVVKQKYIIGRMIGSGTQGSVYKVVDFQNQKTPLVIKVFQTETSEIKIIKQVNPYIIDYGLIKQIVDDTYTQTEKLLNYFIMPRYGKNIQEIYEISKEKFNREMVLHLGLFLIKELQRIHQAGFIYNDLKLDNVLCGFQEKFDANSSFFLIDYGYATQYYVNGKHMSEETLDRFKGNMLFGSNNQLNFKRTSRRDDMISLLYLIIYILNDGLIPGYENFNKQKSNYDRFKISQKAKASHTLDNICVKNSSTLRLFAQEILNIGYYEEPKYDILCEMLENSLRDRDFDSCLSSIKSESLEIAKINTMQNQQRIQKYVKAQSICLTFGSTAGI